jgi:hypothetical protein
MNRLWPHSPVPDETLDEWWPLVRDLEYQQVDAVLTVLALDREFPPPAGLLRTTVARLTHNTREVWAEVWHEIMSKLNYYQIPADLEWSSPLVRQLVTMGGWQELCTSNIADLPTIEAQWRNKWESLRDRQVREAAWTGLPTGGLPGLESGQRPAQLEDHHHGNDNKAIDAGQHGAVHKGGGQALGSQGRS